MSTAVHRPRRRLNQKLVRQLHLWTSMASLVIVLFFGLTGITLNHQDWTFGTEPTRSVAHGTLPAGFRSASGQVDLLAVATAVRDAQHVRGDITDHSEQNGQGSITWQGPAYEGDLFFDESTGAYTFTTTEAGWVAAINDLHKGRNTGPVWRWVIDASATLLVLVAATGLTITLLIKTRERSRGLVLAGIGAAAALVGTVIALR